MDNPLWYLVSSFALAIGTFVIWLGVFFWLAGSKTKLRYEAFIGGFSIFAIITYMVWARDVGLVTPLLEMSSGLVNTRTDRAVNGVLLVAVIIAMHYLWEKYRRYIYEALCIGCVAMLVMSGVNIHNAYNSLVNIINNGDQASASSDKNRIVLSKNGKNVIVLMLDGAIGPYVPYMLQEKPELKELFSGFTHYNNTVALGGHTLLGSPGIFGGYEYIPEAMNKREDMSLKDKHNEAMLMLPRLFHEQGYKVTISNPPLFNFQYVLDYTPLKDYPYIRGENFGEADADIHTPEEYEDMLAKNKRNFFCYGLLRTVPVVTQVALYGNGRYNRFDKVSAQTVHNNYKAEDLPKRSLKYYNALEEMTAKTKFVDRGNTYLAMANDLTHDGALFQLPDYKPMAKVDNSALVDYEKTRLYNDIKMELKYSVQTYHTNMAALLRIGEWLKYLKAQGVYDNTRIIIVSDHGLQTSSFPDLLLNEKMPKSVQKKQNRGNMCLYACLLMVKDFDAKEFRISDEFMTNADVPVLATKDLVTKAVNPFTGNMLNNKRKEESEMYIFESTDYEFRYNRGAKFAKGRWFGVKNNIWDSNNWRLAKEDAQMPY